jgi:hypothetical protein
MIPEDGKARQDDVRPEGWHLALPRLVVHLQHAGTLFVSRHAFTSLCHVGNSSSLVATMILEDGKAPQDDVRPEGWMVWLHCLAWYGDVPSLTRLRATYLFLLTSYPINHFN